MNSAQLKALQDANLATNSNNAITAAKLREFTVELIKRAGGYVYYVNSSSTPQSLASGTELQLTNNGASENTVTTYAPYYVSGALLSSNAIQLSQLSVGDFVQGRFAATLVSGSNNTEIHIYAKFKNSEGTVLETQHFADLFYKNQGTHQIAVDGSFFVSAEAENGTIEFFAEADTNNNTILWTSLLLKTA